MLRSPTDYSITCTVGTETVSTSHVQFEMTTAAPQGIETRQRENFVILRHVRVHQRRDTMKFSKFRISHLTLNPQNIMSKNLSGTPRPNHNHQHISLNNLTGGYRKRLSGFRAANQNVTKMPENSVHQIFVSRARRLQYYLDGGNQNRLYKSYTIRNGNRGAAKH